MTQIKTSSSLAALARKAAALGFTVMLLGAASATPASASGWDHRWNAPLIGGIAGGLVLGSVLNAAAQPTYAPPVYVEDAVVCHRVRQPIYNEYGDVIGSRRVRVCE